VDMNLFITLIVLVHLPKVYQVFGTVAGDCWIISTRQFCYYL